jgi:pyruvate dehydrogenase E1 component
VTLIEPAYQGALDWLFRDAARAIAAGREGAYYFRLSTRPIDQEPFERALERLSATVLERQVLAGAYRLHDASALAATGAPVVHIAASGAVVPEALAAARELEDEGVAAHVVDVTSLDRVHASWRDASRAAVRGARTPALPGPLRVLAGGAPIVTVHDAASHAMAWLGSALGVPSISLGVDEFGQSGTVHDLYDIHDLLPGSIVNAALAALAI